MKPIRPKVLSKGLRELLDWGAEDGERELYFTGRDARAILAALAHEMEAGEKAERERCVATARTRRTSCLDAAEAASARRAGKAAMTWKARAAEAASLAASLSRRKRTTKRVSAPRRKA